MIGRLEKTMKEVLKRTTFAFSDTIYGIEEVLDVLSDLTGIMEQVMKGAPKNPKYLANFDLFARSRVLLRSSYLCLITGNYGSVLCLLRSVLENNELMLFFHLEPQEVNEWRTKPNWWKEKENKVGQAEVEVLVEQAVIKLQTLFSEFQIAPEPM